MKNIVFIGMPGCGKTTISKLYSINTGKKLYDCDECIEARENMPITEIFQVRGEDYFRRVEREILTGLLLMDNIIISAGGGAVLYNSDILKKNSFIVYLTRSIENIIKTIDLETRPLLKNNPAVLYELYEKRHNLYENICDITISNDGSEQETLNNILEALV